MIIRVLIDNCRKFVLVNKVCPRFLIVSLFLGFFQNKAQVYDFQVINQEQGIPSSVITALAQDSRNLIWIGTDGAGFVKYDGATFKIYDESNGLKGTFITDVVEDCNSNIVVATKYNGIEVFDGRSFFKRFSSDDHSLTSNSIYKIIADKNGTYCVSDKEIVFIKKDYSIEKIASNNDIYGYVNSVALDKKGNLCLGASNGFFVLKNRTLKKCFSQFETGYVTLSKSDKNITATIGGSLYQINDPLNNTEAHAIKKLADLPKSFQPKHLFVTQRGTVWISGENKQGLLMFDGETFSNFNYSNGFDGENVLCFMQDNAKNLYIGTEGFGLYKTGPQMFLGFSNQEFLKSPMIFSIYKDSLNLYVGIRKEGVYRFKEDNYGKFVLDKLFLNGLGANIITKNLNNEIIVGTKQGIAKIENDQLLPLKIPFLVKDTSSVVALKQDPTKRYFIGTYGAGLFICDDKFNKIDNFRIANKNFADYVYTIDEFEKNKWYIGTNKGLFILVEKAKNKFEISKQIIDNLVSISTKDSYGNYWFAGTGFVYSCSKKGIIKYNRKNGLTSTLIYTLIADKNGNIWSGSNLGIDKIEVGSSGEIISVKNYNYKNGFKGLETNTRAQCIDNEGNLYLGSGKGLVKCLVNYNLKPGVSSNVLISNIKLSNQQINWLTDASKNKWVNVPAEGYEFKTNENQLTFEYKVVNTGFNQNFYYSYKLEGANDNWSNPTTLNETSYSNLPPGKYVFKVKLVDSQGKDLNTESDYSFSIKAPFYLSWWFIAIVIALLFLVVYILYKKYSSYSNNFIKDYSEFENNVVETRLYFLILGIVLPLTEVFIEIFKVRAESELLPHLIIGAIFLSLYFLCKRNKFLILNSNLIFNLIFLAFAFFTVYKCIFKPFELISFSEFVLVVFFSHGVFKNLKYFLIFNTACFLFFSIFLFVHLIEFKLVLIYLNAILFLTILSYIRHLVNKSAREKLLFANSIVHNGNSLVIATSNLGVVSFCSNNIFNILGYTPEEAMGMGFWELTQDTDFELVDYSQKYIPDRLYVRKLKCKNGDYKYIQWQDKRHSSDLFVGIGQDVTSIVNAENEKIRAQKKIEEHNAIIKELTLSQKLDSERLFPVLENIVRKASLGLNIERVSVWNYHQTHIDCRILFEKNKNSVSRGLILEQKDYPNYFNTISIGEVVNAPDAMNDKSISEFRNDYFPSNNIKSLLDVPIFLQGELRGFVCCESIGEIKNWDAEDVAFAKNISDIISLSIEAQARKKAERQLLFRSEILDAIAKTTEKLLVSKDIQSTLNNSLELIGEATRTDKVYFYESNSKNKRFTLKSNWHSKNYLQPKNTHFLAEIPFNEIDPISNCLFNNKLFFSITSQIANAELKKMFHEQAVLSTLILPIFIKDTLYGFIGFDDCKMEKTWSNDQLIILQSLATNIANAIERINNEQTIKESESNFRLLNETIDDVFWLFDLVNKRVLYVSPSCVNVLGVTLAEFYNTSNYWENYIFNEDKPAILKAHQKMDEDGFYELDYRIKLKDGSIKWVHEKSFGIKNAEGIYTKTSGICTDITEKKKTELALKESESNFRQLNETIEDVFWLYDIKNRKYLYISPNSEQVLGIPDTEFYEGIHTKRDFVFEEDKFVYSTAESWLLTQDSYDIEYRIKKEGGGYKWINEKSFAIRNENGELIRNSGICVDVTEKKKAEAEIKQLSLVAEKTTNGILITDKDGKAVWANQGYLNMFEIPSSELIGKLPRNLFKANDTEFHAKMETFNGNNFSVEIELHTYLNKLLWVELNNTVISDEKGQVLQQIEVLTDITEKVKAKKEIEQYSLDLEFQNTLKEKLINASSLEEITQETLSFVKANIKHCIHISMFTLDEKKQNLYGYQLLNGKILKDRNSIYEIKSYEAIKSGQIFIERDLLSNPIKSVSDNEVIKAGVMSYIILPIINDNELVGSLNVGFDCIFPLTPNEIKNLENFSGLLSVAIKQLNLKNALLTKHNDNISSLMYAKNIQNTILPNVKLLNQSIKEVALLFRPKDIVSGDFYWAREVGDYTFISVADCTGHGVPGAFLTLIGSRILEQLIVIENVTSPAEILTKLDLQLFNSLNVKKEGLVRDGMEISICAINKKTHKLIFAGAGLSLVYFNNNEEFNLKGQRKSIGDYRQDNFYFENHEIDVNGTETFFMATDGYQDQLGGKNYKRLSKKNTMDILKKIKELKPEEQEEILIKELDGYIGNHTQTDDITVLGFKINIKP